MKNKSIDFLFLSSFLIIGILFYTTYRAYNQLDKYNELVDYTYIVKNHLLNMESEFRSMVVTQRTYLLSTDPRYYAMYIDKIKLLDSLNTGLRNLIKDNPVQSTKLDTLHVLLKNREQSLSLEIDQIIEDKELFLKEFKFNNSQSVKDSQDFLSCISGMIEHENELLKVRLDNQVLGEKMTPIGFSVLGLMAFAIIAFAYFKQKRDLEDKGIILENKKLLVKKLLQSRQELEEYSYVATHDMQEPLRKIQMFSDIVLHAQSNKNEVVKTKYLKKVNEAASDAMNILQKFMNHSMFDVNGKELVLCNFSKLFKQITNVQKASFGNTLLIKTQVDDTPEILAFEDQAVQLISNLVSNAIKFRKKSQNELGIQLLYKKVEEDGKNYHRISIKDDSSGFAKEYAEEIFSMFNKLYLHPESNKNSIGLSVCKKIMENHGGKITAESEEHIGTEFSCYFPVA